MKREQHPRPKKQHYVPRLHLRRFIGAFPRGMVWTYDMQTGRTRPSKPSETGVQSNYYSAVDSSGVVHDDLEHLLADIEDRAASPYERLLAGEVPTGQERADFASFVATLYTRSPSQLRASAELVGLMSQTLLNAHWQTREQFEVMMDLFEEENGRQAVGRDELWAFYQSKENYVSVDRKRGIQSMAASDRLQVILFDRHWTIVEPLEGYFITSDSPVFRHVPRQHHLGIMGDGGFLNRHAEVTLPLSPDRALLIREAPLPSRVLRMPAKGVEMMNYFRALSADRYLYAHVKDAAVSELGEEMKDVRGGFRVSGPGPYVEVKVVERSK